ncbi:hypothetical protein OJJOAM_003213 [Cupriavidus sp. H18C1]
MAVAGTLPLTALAQAQSTAAAESAETLPQVTVRAETTP